MTVTASPLGSAKRVHHLPTTVIAFCFQVADALKTVKAIVMYRGDVPEGTDCGFPVYTWDEFMEVRS